MFEGVRQGEQSEVLQRGPALDPGDEVAESNGVGEGSRNSSVGDSNMLGKSFEQVLLFDVTSIVVDVSVIRKGLSREKTHQGTSSRMWSQDVAYIQHRTWTT